MMDVLMLTGRILFAVAFVASGIGHFAKREMMAGFMRPRVRSRRRCIGWQNLWCLLPVGCSLPAR